MVMAFCILLLEVLEILLCSSIISFLFDHLYSRTTFVVALLEGVEKFALSVDFLCSRCS